MSEQAKVISVPQLIFVENKEIMVNMENSLDLIRKLLSVITDLEERITELEG